MNKTYKSIWNETLGTYVAAAETSASAGRKTTSTRRSRRTPARAHAGQLVLEQRIVFDAAMPATVVEVSADSDSGHQELVDAYEVEVEDVSVAPTIRDSEEGSPEDSQPVGEETDDATEIADMVDENETEGGEQTVLEAEEETSGSDEVPDADVDMPEEGEVDAALDPARVEIIVLDAEAADITDFIATHPGEIIYLDADRDGVEQLAEVLQGRSDIDAIHILSHGAAGQVRLGSTVLTTESIQGEHAGSMETIRSALSPDADLLLYGCDIADDEVGLKFVQTLADATGADVAASVDATGASELGGNWVLEVQHGQIETEAVVVGDWQGLLGTPVSITSANVLSPGLGFSVQAFNMDGSVGTVSVRTTAPPGFGVAGGASGDSAEIGEAGGLAERLEISFDGSVESADVWIAWLNSSETALVNMYQGADLVGSWTQVGGTDSVDGPFLLSAGGVPFDRMEFTVPTGNAVVGDDFLVNRIDFVLLRPPSAQNDALTTSEDAPVSGSLFANNGNGVDSDPDGDSFSVTSNTDPSNGAVVIAPDGNFTYTPNPDFNGTDSFTYTITDTDGGTSTATVSITVTPVNDAPVVDTPLADQSDLDAETITPIATAGAFSDIDGDTLSFSATGLPAGLSIDAGTGEISGTLSSDASQGGPTSNGVYSVTVTANDGNGGTVSDTFTYTVGNPPPLAADDGFTAVADTPAVVGNALGNDSDPDGDALAVTPQNGVAGSNGGIFSIDAAGVVSFDPAGAFDDLPPGDTRDTTLVYEISDGQGGFDTATITVTVNGANDPPVAVDDGFTTDEDTSVSITVLGNDSDPDGDPLTVSEIDGQPAVVGTPVTLTDGSGTVTLNLDGTLTFDPTPDYNGPVSFTYEVEDGNGGSDTATVTGTVTPVNDPPVAMDDGFTAAADAPTAVVGNALGNDSDPDGDALVVTPQSGVAGSNGGLFSIDAAGVVSFDPAGAFDDLPPGDTRDTTLVYEISDGQGGFDTATITVTVTGINEAPVATDNAYAVGEDDAAAVVGNALTDDSGAGVDSDIDGGTLVVTPQSGVAGSAGGIFSIDAAGVITFDPNGEFENLAVGDTATTTLVYEISDGQGGIDTATITITINGANDAPVGADDSITASEDVPLAGTLPVGVDVDGDVLSYALASAPANGAVVINANGSYTYTPAADYNGADSFTYTVSDSNGGSNTYTVSVSVTPVQDTAEDNLSTPEDTAITFNVLTGAGGASADNFEGTPVVTATTNPANGVIVVAGDGTITYTPNANYNGPDSFTYTVTSPAGVTETETVNITVTAVNDPPVAADDGFTTDEDTSVNIPVLGNDSDPDGDPLTVSEIDGQPAVVGTPVTLTDGSGTVTLNLDGTLTFEPTPDYNGPVSFTYEVEDGNGGSDTATVTGTVNPVNDPPVAVDDGPFTTSANVALTGNVLGNDSDPDGNALTVTGFTIAGDPTVRPAGTTASMPGVGSLVIQPDGSFTFVPDTDYAGPVPSATYTLSDGMAVDTAVLSFGDVQPGPPVPPAVAPLQPAPGNAPAPVSPSVEVLAEINPPLITETPSAGGTSQEAIAPLTPRPPASPVPGNHLHVLVAVGESSQSQFLSGAGLTGIQANAPLLGEALSQTPDNLLFVQAGSNHLGGMGAEPGLGDVRQVPHALHVQHAVRHQPIVTDIGLFVHQAVRASQLESAVRNAVLDAHHSASPGFDTLIDPFALGAPHPDASAEPANETAADPAPQASEAQSDEGDAGSDQAMVEKTPTQTEPAKPLPRAAVGFRAQLQGMSRDRAASARPLTRDVAHV